MHFIYDEDDDILVLRISDKKIVRERSQDWNTHISYAEDDSIVEIVILEASKQGVYPLQYANAA